MKKPAATIAFAVLILTAPVHAETVNCTPITSLPYTITTQGVYCLTGHLSTGITVGNAITIDTNNVVLDLNGFKIGGLSAGLGTQAIGIYANQRQNISIRNGTVRGFFTGIRLDDVYPSTASQGHVIEDIRADQNTYVGMWIHGKGNIIRNNQVVSTGGSAFLGANASAFAIRVVGPGARLLNNDVADVAAQGGGSAWGFFLYQAASSMVVGNRVSNITATTASYGIDLASDSGHIVRDNSLSGMQAGITFNSSNGKYVGNVTHDVATPYYSGTAGGTTNY